MSGVAIVALAAVLIVSIAVLWRRPSPNHSFIFDLVKKLAEEQVAAETLLSHTHDNNYGPRGQDWHVVAEITYQLSVPFCWIWQVRRTRHQAASLLRFRGATRCRRLLLTFR